MKLLHILACCLALTGVCARAQFVTVDDGEFRLDGQPYRYIGTNFWYGPILANPGEGGDFARLTAELDTLKALGIDNLRVLAGAEGKRDMPIQISPNLQPEPGVYNQDLLEGLDRFLAELEKRDMRAVIFLTNAWEWSGGLGKYLEWAGRGKTPNPQEDYSGYEQFITKFYTDSVAQGLFADHVRRIVGRTNSVTGKPYSESPAIMAWQIANEPRPFSRDAKEPFADWILKTARLIKSIDPNHLVSTGSEGEIGCARDLDLWRRIHNDPAIDYATIHIWPYIWRWCQKESLQQDLVPSLIKTADYINLHRAATAKPLVLEEFGWPREGVENSPDVPTTTRDTYYDMVFQVNSLQGINFWGWGGQAVPQHERWQPGDPYMCDPAHEPQGFFSVFITDTPTVNIIRKYANHNR